MGGAPGQVLASMAVGETPLKLALYEKLCPKKRAKTKYMEYDRRKYIVKYFTVKPVEWEIDGQTWVMYKNILCVITYSSRDFNVALDNLC